MVAALMEVSPQAHRGGGDEYRGGNGRRVPKRPARAYVCLCVCGGGGMVEAFANIYTPVYKG